MTLVLYLLGLLVCVHCEDRQRPNAFQRITGNLTDLETQDSDLQSKYEELKESLNYLEEFINDCPQFEDTDIVTPENAIQDLHRRFWIKGDVVSFPCETDFYQCGSTLTATCLEEGLWTTSGDSKCVNKNFRVLNPEVDAVTDLPCELRAGATVIIKGQPTDYNKFIIQFKDDIDDLLLNIGCRNNWEKVVVYNSQIGGIYGTEVRVNGMTFPLDQQFTFVVTRTTDGFKVSFDNKTPKERSSETPKPTVVSQANEVPGVEEQESTVQISINDGQETHFKRNVKNPTKFRYLANANIDEMYVEYP